MSGFFYDLIKQFNNNREKRHNKPFLNAAMAACVMVSMSEGEVNLCDRIKLDKIISTLDKLSFFDPHEGVEIFNHYTNQIKKSPKQGHAEALSAVSAVISDKKTAELLVRLCLAISLSDGKTSLVEHIEIMTLCNIIGVDPNTIGLNINAMLARVPEHRALNKKSTSY